MLWRHVVDPRMMRYFLAIVDTGSVTAGSKVVFITQPSLSRQIRQLEARLGFTLFQKHNGRLVLTAAGRRFVPIARDLVWRFEAAARAASAIATGQLQEVTFAAARVAIRRVVAPFIASLTVNDPMPTVVSVGPKDVYAMIVKGADLLVSADEPPVRLERLHIVDLPVHAFVSPSHPWATRGRISMAELTEQPLILMNHENHSRLAFDEACVRASLKYLPLMEFEDPMVAQAVVASGRGVGVMSEIDRFGLKPLEIVGAERPIAITMYAAWDPQHHAASDLAGIAEQLRIFLGDPQHELL
jgi:DNA-binding transcriptional LysR family regulator